jgi:hypothetical protein
MLAPCDLIAFIFSISLANKLRFTGRPTFPLSEPEPF